MLRVAPEDRERLRPYLPRLVLQWVAERPEAVSGEIDGSIAFADISGFTQLSERLAELGKRGAEEVADAIGTSFTGLLAIAYEEGGSLLKFGGDALLILFEGEDHPVRASRAAAGMRRALREMGSIQTPRGRVTLRMSVGVHSGTFHLFLVGSSHRELIVTGPAATEVVAMEAAAEAGDVLLSPATAESLPARFLGEKKGPGRLLKRRPQGGPSGMSSGKLELPDDIESCVPVAVRRALLEGALEREHRLVTVAFLRFEGTDRLIEEEGAAAAEPLAGLVEQVQRAADRHDVAFLGTDVDRDGGKIILASGAPRTAGNDEERLLLAVREVLDAGCALPVRVGVHGGRVFAGDIGPAYRRTYTVMGDAVNLAARLMARAEPGQVISSSWVLGRSRTVFRAERLPPFRVKGKSEPISACSVGSAEGAKVGVVEEHPFVGREREMAVLLEGLSSARAGAGRAVEVIGDAGIGKSRLMRELRARVDEGSVYAASCELYESRTPYRPFRDLLRDAYGIPGDASESDAEQVLRALVEERAAPLLPWLPLLALPLHVDLPSTPQVEELEERFRRQRVEQVTTELLETLLAGPTLITVEDAHWMDEASASLLAHLVRTVADRPWLLCVTRRDHDSSFAAPEGPATTILRPEPLDTEAARSLLGAASEESPLRPHEVAALAERAGGNPLFLIELLAAARRVGDVDAIPDSVEALIAARIDRLAPQDRALLRRASVLGLSFEEKLAASIFGDDAAEPAAWDRLDEFVDRENGALRFRHALIREAAYEGLPYRVRRELHAAAAESIERAADDRPDEAAELLSLHFFNAGRHPEAWRYSRLAGRQAQEIHANVEAAALYQRALEAARRSGEVASEHVAEVLEALGEVKSRSGLYEEAARAYREARRRANGGPVRSAQLMLKEAETLHWLGLFPRAMSWVTRAIRGLEGMESEEAAATVAKLASLYALCRFRQGRYREAARWAQRAVTEAEKAGDKAALGEAYRMLDMVEWSSGGTAGDTYGRVALGIFEELGDLSKQANALNNLGVRAVLEARWDEALELLERAGESFSRIGHSQGVIIAAFNRGDLLVRRGRLEEAEALLHEALRMSRAVGDREGVAFATRELGRAASRAGRHDEGLALLARARAAFVDLGARNEALETDAAVAEGRLLAGDWQGALQLATTSITHATRIEGQPLLPILHRVRGYALIEGGRLDEAREALEEAVRIGRAQGAGDEVAFALAALARSAHLLGDREASRLEREAQELKERLGVAFVPPIRRRGRG